MAGKQISLAQGYFYRLLWFPRQISCSFPYTKLSSMTEKSYLMFLPALPFKAL